MRFDFDIEEAHHERVEESSKIGEPNADYIQKAHSRMVLFSVRVVEEWPSDKIQTLCEEDRKGQGQNAIDCFPIAS